MPPPPGGPGPNVQPPPPVLPLAMLLVLAPVDRWGITFDLRTSVMQQPPPNGWGVRRGTIYTRIARRLSQSGYAHVQGSVYNHQQNSGLAVFQDMCNLRSIEPIGIFSTAVTAIEMFRIPHQTMIATDPMRLGGQFAPHLFGTTPTNLVPNNIASVPHPLDPDWSW